jgi:hypothetical protein
MEKRGRVTAVHDPHNDGTPGDRWLSRRNVVAALSGGFVASQLGSSSDVSAETVTSVNGQTGAVVLDRDEIAAPRPYLLGGSGGSLDGVLNALLEWAHGTGGGTVMLPTSSGWTISEPITIKDGVILDLQGSKLTTTVSGAHAIVMTQTGLAGPTRLSPVLRNGWIVGTANAHGGVLADTATGCRIYDVRFDDFVGTGGGTGEVIRGAAIHLRNSTLWNENVWIIGCSFKNNRHALVTTPATLLAPPGGDVDVNGGTDSFARLRFERSWIGGSNAAVGWPLIFLRGSVYASTIREIGGNVNGSTTIIALGAGWMPGTVIERIGFEAHNSSPGPSAMFQSIGGWPGPAHLPILGDGIDYRNHGMTLWKGTAFSFAARQCAGGIRLQDRPAWPDDTTGTTIFRDAADGQIKYRPQGSPAVWQIAATKSGSTANRPASPPYIGFQYFDQTLGKPIWWNGTGWRDATGAAV